MREMMRHAIDCRTGCKGTGTRRRASRTGLVWPPGACLGGRDAAAAGRSELARETGGSGEPGVKGAGGAAR